MFATKRISELRGSPQQPLISQLILYGFYHHLELTMQDIRQNKIKVGMLQHYENGTIINNNEDSDFYQMWAYPDGIKIFDSHLTVINDPQPEHSFGDSQNISLYCSEPITGTNKDRPSDFIYSFVHTDYQLNRTYFTALCWHQKKYCPLDRQKLDLMQHKDIYTHRIPKCTLWQLENDPLMIDFNKQLVYIPKVLMLASNCPLFQFQRELIRFYYRNVLARTNDLLINQSQLNHFKDLVHLVGYPEAENYFDQESITASNLQVKYRQVQKQDLQQFYTSFLFLPKFNRKVNHITLQDCWNSSVKFSPICYSKNICFSKANVGVLSVLKRIGVKNLITLWKCLLLQRHILIFSMNNLQVIELCESLFWLLEPVRWQNIYIPFLPFHLVNNIDAIQSYIIGVSRIHMDYVIEHFPMQDIVLVDLDQNIIIENGGKNQIQLPPPIQNMLKSRLSQLGFKKDTILSNFFRDRNQTHALGQEDRLFKVRLVFFDALLYLLNNYRKWAQLNQSGLLQFNRDGYRSMFGEQEWGLFAGELVNTMVFVRLCEYHLYEQKILQWNQSNMGGLFVYCQNILAEKTKGVQRWEIPKCDKGKIQAPYHQYFNYVLKCDIQLMKESKREYKLQHYLIKYLSYRELSKEGMENNQPQRREKRSNLVHIIIDFLFPWVREIEEECHEEQQSNNCRKSLRLSLLNLPDLQCLFGQMKRQSSALPKATIQKLLKESKNKKSNYLNIKMLQAKHVNERISV